MGQEHRWGSWVGTIICVLLLVFGLRIKVNSMCVKRCETRPLPFCPEEQLNASYTGYRRAFVVAKLESFFLLIQPYKALAAPA